MARYTGPVWKLSRRLGISLSGTGKELERRPYPPGQHGPNQRKKMSEYGLQLAEKQKLRYTYGLTERQFKNTFIKAGKLPGKHGDNFVVLLEKRLDNVVYRMGLARTRRAARQLVNHGHILVDGKRVDIPSYQVSTGQVISVREKSAKNSAILESLEVSNYTPDYVQVNPDTLEGSLTRDPEASEAVPEINTPLIVEYYQR